MSVAGKGLVLFAHGARDARWAEPFERLREMLTTRLGAPVVELAYLELMQPDLRGAIANLVAKRCTAVTIVPIFLGRGGHIERDLPDLVEKLRGEFAATEIECAAPAGEDEGILAAIASYCLQQFSPDRS